SRLLRLFSNVVIYHENRHASINSDLIVHIIDIIGLFTKTHTPIVAEQSAPIIAAKMTSLSSRGSQLASFAAIISRLKNKARTAAALILLVIAISLSACAGGNTMPSAVPTPTPIVEVMNLNNAVKQFKINPIYTGLSRDDAVVFSEASARERENSINNYVEQAWARLSNSGQLDNYITKRGNSAEAVTIGKALLLIQIFAPDTYEMLKAHNTVIYIVGDLPAAGATYGSNWLGTLGTPIISVNAKYTSTFSVARILIHEAEHVEKLPGNPFQFVFKHNPLNLIRNWWSEVPPEELQAFAEEAKFSGDFGIRPKSGNSFVNKFDLFAPYYDSKWSFIQLDLIVTFIFYLLLPAVIWEISKKVIQRERKNERYSYGHRYRSARNRDWVDYLVLALKWAIAPITITLLIIVNIISFVADKVQSRNQNINRRNIRNRRVDAYRRSQRDSRNNDWRRHNLTPASQFAYALRCAYRPGLGIHFARVAVYSWKALIADYFAGSNRLRGSPLKLALRLLAAPLFVFISLFRPIAVSNNGNIEWRISQKQINNLPQEIAASINAHEEGLTEKEGRENQVSNYLGLANKKGYHIFLNLKEKAFAARWALLLKTIRDIPGSVLSIRGSLKTGLTFILLLVFINHGISPFISSSVNAAADNRLSTISESIRAESNISLIWLAGQIDPGTNLIRSYEVGSFANTYDQGLAVIRFIRAYQDTGDLTYLNYARGILNFYRDRAIKYAGALPYSSYDAVTGSVIEWNARSGEAIWLAISAVYYEDTTGDTGYRNSIVLNITDYVIDNLQDIYNGGIFVSPTIRNAKSTEHNLSAVALFTHVYRLNPAEKYMVARGKVVGWLVDYGYNAVERRFNRGENDIRFATDTHTIAVQVLYPLRSTYPQLQQIDFAALMQFLEDNARVVEGDVAGYDFTDPGERVGGGSVISYEWTLEGVVSWQMLNRADKANEYLWCIAARFSNGVVPYASKAIDTTHGWIASTDFSVASTAWFAYANEGFSPMFMPSAPVYRIYLPYVVSSGNSRALDALAVAVVWSGMGLVVGLSIGFIWAIPLFIPVIWNLAKVYDIRRAFLTAPKESRAPPLSTPIAQNNNGTITLNPASSKLIIYNPLAHEQLHSNLSGLPAFLQEFIIHTIDFVGLIQNNYIFLALKEKAFAQRVAIGNLNIGLPLFILTGIVTLIVAALIGDSSFDLINNWQLGGFLSGTFVLSVISLPSIGESIARGRGFNSIGIWYYEVPTELFPQGKAVKRLRSVEAARIEFRNHIIMSTFVNDFATAIELFANEIVMEYVPGIVLSDILENKVPVPEGLNLSDVLDVLKKQILGNSRGRIVWNGQAWVDIKSFIDSEIKNRSGIVTIDDLYEIQGILTNNDLCREADDGLLYYPQDMNPGNIIISAGASGYVAVMLDSGRLLISGYAFDFLRSWNNYYALAYSLAEDYIRIKAVKIYDLFSRAAGHFSISGPGAEVVTEINDRAYTGMSADIALKWLEYYKAEFYQGRISINYIKTEGVERSLGNAVEYLQSIGRDIKSSGSRRIRIYKIQSNRVTFGATYDKDKRVIFLEEALLERIVNKNDPLKILTRIFVHELNDQSHIRNRFVEWRFIIENEWGIKLPSAKTSYAILLAVYSSALLILGIALRAELWGVITGIAGILSKINIQGFMLIAYLFVLALPNILKFMLRSVTDADKIISEIFMILGMLFKAPRTAVIEAVSIFSPRFAKFTNNFTIPFIKGILAALGLTYALVMGGLISEMGFVVFIELAVLFGALDIFKKLVGSEIAKIKIIGPALSVLLSLTPWILIALVTLMFDPANPLVEGVNAVLTAPIKMAFTFAAGVARGGFGLIIYLLIILPILLTGIIALTAGLRVKFSLDILKKSIDLKKIQLVTGVPDPAMSTEDFLKALKNYEYNFHGGLWWLLSNKKMQKWLKDADRNLNAGTAVRGREDKAANLGIPLATKLLGAFIIGGGLWIFIVILSFHPEFLSQLASHPWVALAGLGAIIVLVGVSKIIGLVYGWAKGVSKTAGDRRRPYDQAGLAIGNQELSKIWVNKSILVLGLLAAVIAGIYYVAQFAPEFMVISIILVAVPAAVYVYSAAIDKFKDHSHNINSIMGDLGYIRPIWKNQVAKAGAIDGIASKNRFPSGEGQVIDRALTRIWKPLGIIAVFAVAVFLIISAFAHPEIFSELFLIVKIGAIVLAGLLIIMATIRGFYKWLGNKNFELRKHTDVAGYTKKNTDATVETLHKNQGVVIFFFGAVVLLVVVLAAQGLFAFEQGLGFIVLPIGAFAAVVVGIIGIKILNCRINGFFTQRKELSQARTIGRSIAVHTFFTRMWISIIISLAVVLGVTVIIQWLATGGSPEKLFVLLIDTIVSAFLGLFKIIGSLLKLLGPEVFIKGIISLIISGVVTKPNTANRIFAFIFLTIGSYMFLSFIIAFPEMFFNFMGQLLIAIAEGLAALLDAIVRALGIGTVLKLALSVIAAAYLARPNSKGKFFLFLVLAIAIYWGMSEALGALAGFVFIVKPLAGNMDIRHLTLPLHRNALEENSLLSHNINSLGMFRAADIYASRREMFIAQAFRELGNILKVLEDYLVMSGKVMGPPVVAYRNASGPVRNLNREEISRVLLSLPSDDYLVIFGKPNPSAKEIKAKIDFVNKHIDLHESYSTEEEAILAQAELQLVILAMDAVLLEAEYADVCFHLASKLHLKISDFGIANKFVFLKDAEGEDVHFWVETKFWIADPFPHGGFGYRVISELEAASSSNKDIYVVYGSSEPGIIIRKGSAAAKMYNSENSYHDLKPVSQFQAAGHYLRIGKGKIALGFLAVGLYTLMIVLPYWLLGVIRGNGIRGSPLYFAVANNQKGLLVSKTFFIGPLGNWVLSQINLHESYPTEEQAILAQAEALGGIVSKAKIIALDFGGTLNLKPEYDYLAHVLFAIHLILIADKDLRIYIISGGKPAFDLSDYANYDMLFSGRFEIRTSVNDKAEEMRRILAETGIDSSRIIAFGDNPYIDNQMALEKGVFVRVLPVGPTALDLLYQIMDIKGEKAFHRAPADAPKVETVLYETKEIEYDRQKSLERSEYVLGLINKAAEIAEQRLSEKVAIRIKFTDGSTSVRAVSLDDPVFGRYEVVEYSGKNYFIAANGSLARGDDFTSHSDSDFIVFPADEDSVAYAQALQVEMNLILEELFQSEGLALKIDDHLTGIYKFNIPPERVAAELLVPTIALFEPEFQMWWNRPSITSAALRDLRFISGDIEAFNRMISLITPYLYPYRIAKTGQEIVTRAEELIALIFAWAEKALQAETSNKNPEELIKELGLRLIQYYVWIMRSVEGITLNSVFDVLGELSERQVISCEDAQVLVLVYSSLLAEKDNLSSLSSAHMVRERVLPHIVQAREIIRKELARLLVAYPEFGQNNEAGAIGELHILQASYEPKRGVILALIRRLGDNPASRKNIAIRAERAPPYLVNEALMHLIASSCDILLKKIIYWYTDYFVRSGHTFIMLDNSKGVLGFGSARIVALSSNLINNPVAWFHEIAHAYFAVFPKDLVKLEAGLAEGRIRWVNSKPRQLRTHYLIRAFQRQVFGEEDRYLTELIHATLLENRFFAAGELFRLGEHKLHIEDLLPLAESLENAAREINSQESLDIADGGLLIDAGGYSLGLLDQNILDVVIRDSLGREIASIKVYPLINRDSLTYDKKAVFVEWFGITQLFLRGKGVSGKYLYQALSALLLKLGYDKIYCTHRTGSERFWKKMNFVRSAEQIYISGLRPGYFVENPYGNKKSCPIVSGLYEATLGGRIDPARPLPGQPMSSREEVNAAIEQVGWDNAQVIRADVPEVSLASAYLRNINRYDMAEYLEHLANAGLIRAGPFKGFLAATYLEGIALSTYYPEYNTTLEKAASLVHEIGAVRRFHFTHQENSAREEGFLTDNSPKDIHLFFARRYDRHEVLASQGLSPEIIERLSGNPLMQCSESEFVRAVLVSMGVTEFEPVTLGQDDLRRISGFFAEINTGSAYHFNKGVDPQIIKRLVRDFRIIGYKDVYESIYVDVRDAEGNTTGIFVPRDQAHLDNDLHADVYIFVFNSEGELLVQTRSAEKQIYPLKREASASGHVIAGETAQQAAVNILRKELNIEASLDNLILLGQENALRRQEDFPEAGVRENIATTVYAYILSDKDVVSLNPREVKSIEFVDFDKELRSLNVSSENYASVKYILTGAVVVNYLRQIASQIREYRIIVGHNVKIYEILFRIRNSFAENKIRSVAFVTPEAIPFAKTGGLGDVSGELPRSLVALGVDTYIITVGYDSILSKYKLTDTGLTIEITIDGKIVPVKIWTKQEGNVTYFFLSAGAYTKAPYRGDKLHLTILLSEGALKAIERMVSRGIIINPQVIHGNDWQAGLIPVLIKTKYYDHPLFGHTATVFSIHNPKFRADYLPGHRFSELGIGAEHWFGLVQPEAPEYFSVLRGAIFHADKLNTVSPTNRDELLTDEYGETLVDLLRMRAEDFIGIMNGVDYEVWNPVQIEEAPVEKALLQANLGFEVNQEIPLIGMVARISSQKGILLMLEVIGRLLIETNGRIQFVFLGKGDDNDPYNHQAVAQMQKLASDSRWLKNVRFMHKYTTEEQIKVFRGIDMFLYPSSYEPCGTKPIVALINGKPCVVRETGGLANSVQEYDKETGTGNGFVFIEFNSEDFYKAMLRALVSFGDKDEWQKVSRNAQAIDRSWSFYAMEYVELYREAITKKLIYIAAEGSTNTDPARPLPGQPMPSKEKVNAVIQQVGWDDAPVLAADAAEIKLAVSYLKSINEVQMAEYLEYLVNAGLIRAGPFQGFLASIYHDAKGQESIALSIMYPAYNSIIELAKSLIHEIGATQRFHLGHQENTLREEGFNSFAASVGLEIALRMHAREGKEAAAVKAKNDELRAQGQPVVKDYTPTP
ncbi:MAG: glycogen/starch synthase, partial [Candidatus Omnitrophota bacterium]